MNDKKYLMFIKADWNDADYIYSHREITGIELDIIKRLYPVIISSKIRHNYPIDSFIMDMDEEDYDYKIDFPYSNVITLNEFFVFNKLLPTEYSGEQIHSIKEIWVFDKGTEISLTAS
jgi:hypothetical protein